jgi:hypothetical protein
MVLTGIGIVLLFLAVGASLVAMALRRREPPLVCPQSPPARPYRRRQRTRADRQIEDRLIVAGLAAGLTPPQIARVLRGSPSWRYRRVRVIQQRLRLALVQ